MGFEINDGVGRLTARAILRKRNGVWKIAGVVTDASDAETEQRILRCSCGLHPTRVIEIDQSFPDFTNEDNIGPDVLG